MNIRIKYYGIYKLHTASLIGCLTSDKEFHLIVNISTSRKMDGIWLDELWESF